MDAPQSPYLLGSRVLQVFWNRNVSEVHGEVVAPHGEPLEVAQRLPLRHGQRDVLVPVPTQHARTAALISQASGSVVVGPRAGSHVEIGGCCWGGSVGAIRD